MQRNVLLNPGPATTTDTVKRAQLVPDICPREREFGDVMRQVAADLLRVAHAPAEEFAAVLFAGSGTLAMDVCVNSLLPESGALLIVNNGSYSARAVDIARAYRLPHVNLTLPSDRAVDAEAVERVLRQRADVRVVYATHQETGSGVLNDIAAIGRAAHAHGATFVADTTSTYAMIPLDLREGAVDFCMASAQKGIQGMAGLCFVLGRRALIEASASYPRRSYYCNLHQQYASFAATGQMRFTPPVQTIYAARQALAEYFAEGEQAKWARHQRTTAAIHAGLARLGLRESIAREQQSGLVVAVDYPADRPWSFDAVHDYCYARGFTIYPGKMQGQGTFRLCSLGAIDEADIARFFDVFTAALRSLA